MTSRQHPSPVTCCQSESAVLVGRTAAWALVCRLQGCGAAPPVPGPCWAHFRHSPAFALHHPPHANEQRDKGLLRVPAGPGCTAVQAHGALCQRVQAAANPGRKQDFPTAQRMGSKKSISDGCTPGGPSLPTKVNFVLRCRRKTGTTCVFSCTLQQKVLPNFPMSLGRVPGHCGGRGMWLSVLQTGAYRRQ